MQGVMIKSGDDFVELIKSKPFSYGAPDNVIRGRIEEYMSCKKELVAYVFDDHYVYSVGCAIDRYTFTSIVCMKEYRRLLNGKSTTTL